MESLMPTQPLCSTDIILSLIMETWLFFPQTASTEQVRTHSIFVHLSSTMNLDSSKNIYSQRITYFLKDCYHKVSIQKLRKKKSLMISFLVYISSTWTNVKSIIRILILLLPFFNLTPNSLYSSIDNDESMFNMEEDVDFSTSCGSSLDSQQYRSTHPPLGMRKILTCVPFQLICHNAMNN